MYFRILLPLMFDPRTPGGAAHTFAGVWLSFNILFNYAWCVRTDPGSPPDLFDAAEEGGAQHAGGPRSSVGHTPGHGRGRPRWCRKCQNVKPPVAHHCSVCKRCVLKMDHHCPWMNNCVGLKNYRYFFLFLFYLWSGCAYACAVCYIPVADEPDMLPVRWAIAWVWRVIDGVDAPQPPPASASLSRALEPSERSAILFSFILALAVFLALSVLLSWHVYLVATAQTTIDFYGNRDAARAARKEGRVWRNDFDLGVRRNWQETFDEKGPFWWVTWVMPRLALHRGTGMTFPSAAAEAAKREGESRRMIPRIPEED